MLSNGRSSASTVTQTWQVGPGRAGSAASTFEDSEKTLTALALRSCFRLISKEKNSVNAIDLAPGTHSFFLESSGALCHSVGRHPKAEFEINIYTEGGFFVDVTGRRSALLNGRECFWARLRSGDEILFGRDKWLVEAGDTVLLEETVARARQDVSRESAVLILQGEVPGSVDLDGTPQESATKPKAKLVVFVAIAVLGMSLLSAYLGYGLAKEQQVTLVTTNGQAPLAAAEEFKREKVNVIQEAPQLPFGENEFAEVLDAFRSGRVSEACAILAARSRILDGQGIWAAKARLLFERRCR